MKLAVPDMISNSYFPAIAAIELGFFKQEGLDVELELIFPVDKSYVALREGTLAAEHRVAFEGERSRRNPEFEELRYRLLAELGVAADAELAETR